MQYYSFRIHRLTCSDFLALFVTLAQPLHLIFSIWIMRGLMIKKQVILQDRSVAQLIFRFVLRLDLIDSPLRFLVWHYGISTLKVTFWGWQKVFEEKIPKSLQSSDQSLDRKKRKSSRTENLNLRELLALQTAYLTLKCSFIIASIVLNHNFEIGRCKIHYLFFVGGWQFGD